MTDNDLPLEARIHVLGMEKHGGIYVTAPTQSGLYLAAFVNNDDESLTHTDVYDMLKQSQNGRTDELSEQYHDRPVLVRMIRTVADPEYESERLAELYSSDHPSTKKYWAELSLEQQEKLVDDHHAHEAFAQRFRKHDNPLALREPVDAGRWNVAHGEMHIWGESTDYPRWTSQERLSYITPLPWQLGQEGLPETPEVKRVWTK